MPQKPMLVLLTVAAAIATSCATDAYPATSGVVLSSSTQPTPASADSEPGGGLSDAIVATWSSGGGSIWMAEGDVVDLEGTFLQFARVLEDSRCPPDTTCVWAGELVVEMRFHGDVPITFDLALPGDAVGLDHRGRKYSLSVVDALQTVPTKVEVLIENG